MLILAVFGMVVRWIVLHFGGRLFVLGTVVLSLFVQTISAYEVVKYCPTTSKSDANCKLYLLNNAKMQAREIVDSITMSFLEIIQENLKTVQDLGSYRIGEPVPQLKRNNWTPDEVIRVELLLLSVLQDPLMYDITFLGPFVNPSITIFDNRLLLATSLQWGETMGCKGPQSDMVEFRWINHTDFPIIDKGKYMGVPTNDSSALAKPIVGQDPRLLKLSETTVLVAFTNHRYHPVRMGFLIIEASPITKRLVIREDYHLISWGGNHGQKNWTPFIHKNVIYFVQRISPFRVVGINWKAGTDKMLYFDKYWNVVAPSLEIEQEGIIPWNYGEIRGGSNAILVDIEGHQPCYVAFFHSSKHITGNSYLTYFFGAYAFTAEKPFKLISASPYPIIDPSLYQGPWSFITLRRIDYVPFPTGLALHNGVLYLSFGHQDWKGMIAKMNASSLLASLIPIRD
jgi:hypothetical protein